MNIPQPGQKDAAVKAIQQALLREGIKLPKFGADGDYGGEMTSGIKEFQKRLNEAQTGILTESQFNSLMNPPAPKPIQNLILDDFHGDLAWVHHQEGDYKSKFPGDGEVYWPGGASGCTIDPGVDLGYVEFSMIEKYYKDVLTQDQMSRLKPFLGKKGDEANEFLKANKKTVGDIIIKPEQALKVMPFVADLYWDGVVKRFPRLGQKETPGQVQTAMLSLAYNRHYNNPGLKILKDSIADGNWAKVADLIGSMQQDHKLEMIRKRRKLEADFIRSGLQGK